nr:hypothetical protein [Xylophilus rhododendri]
MARSLVLGIALTGLTILGGCSSLITEGSTAGAGIAGTAVATSLTNSASAAAGIGLGVQAAARAAVQYGQRRVHAETQDQIAEIAGPLEVGQVTRWKAWHQIALEPDEVGRVTVSRTISTGELQCKEIVFSVDEAADGKAHAMDASIASGFYVASICKSGSRWQWASAEPATARWGGLQ